MKDQSQQSDTKAVPALSSVTAVVLAGGFGTRLRQVVSDRPKVLAEVQGIPLLAHLLNHLAVSGLRNVVLCTGYMGDRVREILGSTYRGICLTYSQESVPLGTAGALRLASPLIGSNIALVLNGDSLCSVNFSDFLIEHHLHRAEGSVVLNESEDTDRYGKVEVDANGFVTSFEEKSNSAGPGWINAGTYLFNRSLIETIPVNGAHSLERQMFPAWIRRKLYGYKFSGKFLDIGTPESYALAEEFISS